MHNDEIRRSGNVASLDAARQRRQWRHRTRSLASPITNTDAERAGRVLAGLISYDQAVKEIRQQHASEDS